MNSQVVPLRREPFGKYTTGSSSIPVGDIWRKVSRRAMFRPAPAVQQRNPVSTPLVPLSFVDAQGGSAVYFVGQRFPHAGYDCMATAESASRRRVQDRLLCSVSCLAVGSWLCTPAQVVTLPASSLLSPSVPRFGNERARVLNADSGRPSPPVLGSAGDKTGSGSEGRHTQSIPRRTARSSAARETLRAPSCKKISCPLVRSPL